MGGYGLFSDEVKYGWGYTFFLPLFLISLKVCVKFNRRDAFFVLFYYFFYTTFTQANLRIIRLMWGNHLYNIRTGYKSFLI